MIDFIGLREINSELKYVFRIYIPREHEMDSVYMSLSRANYYNDERFVVVVRAVDFYRTWMEGINQFSGENIIFPKDENSKRKYESAIIGFQDGIENPVPLAEVSYRRQLVGITRTSWLLENKVECFPIECSRESSQLFHKNLAYPGTKIKSVSELLHNC